MLGNKKTFIDSTSKTFHKEYTESEFLFLKMLHGSTNLPIDTLMYNDTYYITMPEGPVISIDTIPKNDRAQVRSIISENIPFMLEQISTLQNLNIYYSDCLQWLYYNNKLYLIDMDISYTGVDRDHNNYDLLKHFLSAFDFDDSFITESLSYLHLFKKGTNFLTSDNEIELYNKLNIPDMQKNHVYYCKNSRHIQIDVKNIHLYGENGNMIITENVLNPGLAREWELLRIA